MKVILALVVVAVVAGFGVSWAKDKAESVIHHAVDTALPSKVEGHPWAPLHDGKPVRDARVRFEDGTLASVRCHAALGTYSVRIDHAFSFARAATTPVRPGCPGGRLARTLRHATRVDVSTDGTVDTITFTNAKHDTVATLQGRAR
jgi:hypothetical protein